MLLAPREAAETNSLSDEEEQGGEFLRTQTEKNRGKNADAAEEKLGEPLCMREWRTNYHDGAAPIVTQVPFSPPLAAATCVASSFVYHAYTTQGKRSRAMTRRGPPPSQNGMLMNRRLPPCSTRASFSPLLLLPLCFTSCEFGTSEEEEEEVPIEL